MKVRIPYEDFHRLCYNSLLFADKTCQAGAVIRFETSGQYLYVQSTDDHIAFRDKTYLGKETSHTVWFLPISAVKEIEHNIRGFDKEQEPDDVEWMFAEYATPFDDEFDIWRTMDGMLSKKDVVPPTDQLPWCMNRDRLRPLSLIKTPPREDSKDGYPIDIIRTWDQGLDREVIHFKVGPMAVGAIATLFREVVKDSSAGDGLW